MRKPKGAQCWLLLSTAKILLNAPVMAQAFSWASVSDRCRHDSASRRNKRTGLSPRPTLRDSPMSSTARYNNWLGDLWEELIDFSTYGPSERAILKARRAANQVTDQDKNAEKTLESSFQQAKRKREAEIDDILETENDMDSIYQIKGTSDVDSFSVASFQKAAAAAAQEKPEMNVTISDKESGIIDGYGLRDMLVDKWGVPLDIDFQRGFSQLPFVYVTVLPVVGFGSRKSRHLTELDYLMHLQAVVEILDEYDNLEAWLGFVQGTKQTPKPGVTSVPYRLDLSPSQLQKVLGSRQ